MAKLTSRARKALPKSEFAGPDRSFPIPDASHARNALARAASKSPAVEAKIRAKVHAKYPGIGKVAIALNTARKSGKTGLINRTKP